MISSEHCDETCGCLLTRLDYAPLSKPLDRTEKFDFLWEFVCTTCEDYLNFKPENKPEVTRENSVVVFDCSTYKWVELDLDKIISVSYPYFNDCVSTASQSLCTTDYDPEMQEWVEIDVDLVTHNVTPDQVITQGFSACEQFDHARYKNLVRQALDRAEELADEDADPWSVNFASCSEEVEWVDLFEQLGLSERDLAHGNLDIEKCADRWKILIQEKATQAKEFLVEQKQTLLQENSETTKQELIDENNIEIEELDAISDLIDQEIVAYIDQTDNCETVNELVDVWPPILLPMPFKRDLINMTPLSAYDVEDNE